MRASNIILGIGGSLGGWLVIIGHALILAVIPEVDCVVGARDPWRGTLVMGVLGILSTILVGIGLPWRSGLRWFTIPAVPLLVFALLVVLPYLEVTTGGTHPCAVDGSIDTLAEADVWQRLWPLLQLVFLVGAGWQVVRYWVPSRSDA